MIKRVKSKLSPSTVQTLCCAHALIRLSSAFTGYDRPFRSLHVIDESTKALGDQLPCSGCFYVSTWLGHSAQIFGQTLFWIFLWGCFWMRFTFRSVDFEQSRLLSIMLGDPHPISWRPEKMRTLTSLWARRRSASRVPVASPADRLFPVP